MTAGLVLVDCPGAGLSLMDPYDRRITTLHIGRADTEKIDGKTTVIELQGELEKQDLITPFGSRRACAPRTFVPAFALPEV